MKDAADGRWRRILATVLMTVGVGLGLVGPADAHYYMDRAEAQSTTRQYLHHEVGYHYTSAYCRPQGLSKPRPGYIYHRWICYWAAGDGDRPDCRGTSRVRGSSEAGTFYWRVLDHRGKCQYGWTV